MGVVIVEDEVIETILKARTVYVLIHEDGKVVILILVPEGKRDNLCAWRHRRLNVVKEGFRDMVLHRCSPRCRSANAFATMVHTATAVARASRASLAVTFPPW